MTVVVACRLLGGVLVVADCRVSYPGASPPKPPDDGLQKIYQIGHNLVLGFSGRLSAARFVIQGIKGHLCTYHWPQDPANSLYDVTNWIRERYAILAANGEGGNLKFILAAGTRPRGAGSLIPGMVRRLYPAPSGEGDLECDDNRAFQIIGLKAKSRDAVLQKLYRCYSFAFSTPVLQAVAISQVLMIELMAQNIGTVGGLFPYALLDQKGVRWLAGEWSTSGVGLVLTKGQYVQKVGQRAVPLRTILQWMASPPAPGSIGTVEDPNLRDALGRQRAKCDE